MANNAPFSQAIDLGGPTSLSMRDKETGSTCDGMSGKATAETDAGIELERVPITHSFWFGWVDFYPNTGVYK